MIELLAQVVTVKDNKIEIDITNLLGHGDLAKIVYDALVLIYQTAINNPEELQKMIAPYIDAIVEYVKTHPLETAALVIVGIIAMPLITAVFEAVGVIALVTLAIDFLGSVFPLVGEVFRDVVSFMMNTVIPALRRFVEWLKNVFNPGAAFSQDNPALRIDTGKFHELARRVAAVNRRVKQLDRDLDGLYWQVGLLDVFSLLHADLLVTWSPTLDRVQSYLSETAEAFESADSQVQSMFG